VVPNLLPDSKAKPSRTLKRMFLLAPCLLFLILGLSLSPDKASPEPPSTDSGPIGIILGAPDTPDGYVSDMGLSPFASSPTKLYLGGYSLSGLDLDPGPDEYLIPADTYFVAQYDHSYNFMWAITWQLERGATRRSGPVKLLTDRNGDLICLINFEASLHFLDNRNEPVILDSTSRIFPWMLLFKADDSGNIIWKQAWQGYWSPSFEWFPVTPTMAMDGDSNTYVVANPYELRKYNADGVLEWCYYTTIPGNSVACDSQGNVYLAGYYTDIREYKDLFSGPGSGRGQQPLLPSFSEDELKKYNQHSIVAKLDGEGHFLWAAGWSGTPIPVIAVQNDKLYVVDKWFSKAEYIDTNGNTTELGNQKDCTVLKISDTGTLEWSKPFSSATWFFGFWEIDDVGVYIGGWQTGGLKVSTELISDPGWFLMKVEDESLKIVASAKSGSSSKESWAWNHVHLAPDHHGGAFLETASKKHSVDSLDLDSFLDEKDLGEDFNLMIIRLSGKQLN
jgi:hypothetical protein